VWRGVLWPIGKPRSANKPELMAQTAESAALRGPAVARRRGERRKLQLPSPKKLHSNVLVALGRHDIGGAPLVDLVVEIKRLVSGSEGDSRTLSGHSRRHACVSRFPDGGL